METFLGVTGHLCGEFTGPRWIPRTKASDCVWINGWVNNSKAGDLRRYHAHYDVIVMSSHICACIIGDQWWDNGLAEQSTSHYLKSDGLPWLQYTKFKCEIWQYDHLSWSYQATKRVFSWYMSARKLVKRYIWFFNFSNKRSQLFLTRQKVKSSWRMDSLCWVRFKCIRI